ncbi:MAG: ribosomal RNA small subunit methyltransferase H [Deltaproteobacteria bacterium]|nr:MAG: ribosomal RNA small subunit methyltransferase H [Deltaproteobacteria bacterium]
MAKPALEEQIVHKPVMVREVIEFLNPSPGGIYVDATLGLGGHTEAILKASGAKARVIGFDVDEQALSLAKKRLCAFSENVVFVNENFSRIEEVLKSLGIEEVDGVVADLGLSSFQLEGSKRGFSFLRDEPLDMRMDKRIGVTAFNLINELDFEELYNIFKTYGEERWARRIARCIIRYRSQKPIKTTLELAEIVSEAIPKRFHPRGIHPATRVFQALRIAVNKELENLEVFLRKAIPLLKRGGKIAVISFHSLEDRKVKNVFREFSLSCICPPGLPVCGCGRRGMLRVLTRSPVRPSSQEVSNNPRARSAKLRVGERI